MRTLDTFYQSREWRRFVRVVKAERLDPKGRLICEHCGKPIVREYDCIAHHKEHLTEENINNTMIALNADNIQLVHHKCHNIIHEKFGSKERRVYLVYGAPLSGKTSYVKKAMNCGDLVIDIDSIWQCISGQKRYIKPPRLNAIAFQIRDSLIEAVRYRQGKWLNAYVIGGYPYSGERERLINELGAREIFIDTPEDECLRRLEVAEDERDKRKWKKYIREWFAASSPPQDIGEEA